MCGGGEVKKYKKWDRYIKKIVYELHKKDIYIYLKWDVWVIKEKQKKM